MKKKDSHHRGFKAMQAHALKSWAVCFHEARDERHQLQE